MFVTFHWEKGELCKAALSHWEKHFLLTQFQLELYVCVGAIGCAGLYVLFAGFSPIAHFCKFPMLCYVVPMFASHL